MGLFGKLFGTKESIAVELSKVREFVEKERKKSNALNRDVPEAFAEIKHYIREIEGLLDELKKEQIAVENEQFRKVAKTGLRGFMRRVESLLQKIRPPFDAGAQEIASYCYGSKVLLEKEIFANRKNIAYASTAIPETMREVGKNLQNIEDSLERLSRVINENPIIFSSMIEKLLNEIEKKRYYVEELKRKQYDINKRLKQVEERLDDARRRLGKLQEADDAKKLEELLALKDEKVKDRTVLRAKMLAKFATLKRPLKKMKNACDKGMCRMNHDRYVAMEKLISEPDILLKADPKGVQLKAVLSDLKSCIGGGIVKLKERQREQTLTAIDALLAMNFFNELFWPLNAIDAEIKGIQKKVNEMDINEKIHEVKLEIARLERSIDEGKREKKHMKEEIYSAEEALESIRTELAGLLSKTLGKNIEIV